MEANRWWIGSHPVHTQRRLGAFFIPVHPTQTHPVPQSRSPLALDDNPGFNYSWLNAIFKIASSSKLGNSGQNSFVIHVPIVGILSYMSVSKGVNFSQLISLPLRSMH